MPFLKTIAKHRAERRSGFYRFLPGFCLLLLLAAAPARADEARSAVGWLQNRPMTLFDWGLAQLKQDLRGVATWLDRSGYGIATPVHGLQYSWRREHITLFLLVPVPPKRRTKAACRDLFDRAAKRLMRGAPGGPGQASWYLQSAFVPRSQWYLRPKPNFGERLIRHVTFEIILGSEPDDMRPGQTRRVSCRGPLNAAEDEIRDTITH